MFSLKYGKLHNKKVHQASSSKFWSYEKKREIACKYWALHKGFLSKVYTWFIHFPFHYRLLICSVTSFYFSFNATTEENLENYIPRSTIKLANPRAFWHGSFPTFSNSIVSHFNLSIPSRHALLQLSLSVILSY